MAANDFKWSSVLIKEYGKGKLKLFEYNNCTKTKKKKKNKTVPLLTMKILGFSMYWVVRKFRGDF